MVGKMRMLVILTVTLATLHIRVGENIRENVKSEEILEKMENVALKTYYSPMAHSCSMSPSFVLFCLDFWFVHFGCTMWLAEFQFPDQTQPKPQQ